MVAGLAAAFSPVPAIAQGTGVDPGDGPPPVNEPLAAPTPEPTATPTPDPTPEPTATPTPDPTPEPTATPTPDPTPEPTATPTPDPTPEPTATPTPDPTPEPTATPTPDPTPEPTATPTPDPTPEPTATPTPDPTPEPTATPTPDPTPEPNLVPAFSAAISGLSFEEGEEATAVTLPEAEGGDGTLTYSLTGLPAGMTFDAGARALGGTPSEAGEFELTYTATDEDSDQASFDITITVKAAPRVARSTVAGPGTPTVTRIAFSEPAKPALRVSWTAPVVTTNLERYAIEFRKQGSTTWLPWGQVNDSVLSIDLGTGEHVTLEAGATYEVQVRGIYDGGGFTAWSGTGSGTANSAPKLGSASLADAQLIRGPYATYSSEAGKWGEYFTDSDGDTLTPSVQPQYPGLLKALASTGTEYSIRVEGLNPGVSKLTYGVCDGYGGCASREVTYTIVDSPQRAIMENSPAGTNVGDPVAGTPYGKETLTHTLHGDAATYFDIDAATGQISVKQGTTLDYETTTTYTGQVRWTVQKQQSVANLTINVANMVTGKPAAPTVTRAASSVPANPALNVSWTAPYSPPTGFGVKDPATWYVVQYRKKAAVGADPAAWTTYTYSDSNGDTTSTIPKSTLSVTLTNLEAAATYEVQVRAGGNNEGLGDWSDSGEGKVNRPPNRITTIPDPTITWLETEEYDLAASGAAHFEDPDGDALTYSASSTHACIIGVSVEGSVLSITALNPAASSVVYNATDPYGGFASSTVRVTGSANVTLEVPEHSAAGTKVGAAITATPCGDEYISYGFDGDAASSSQFVIDHETGQISVAEGATLDHETTSSYTGRVHWVVHSDQYPAATVTINITDVGAAKPGTPSVTRTLSSEPIAPALDVTWTAATANGGATITGHNVQYRKKAAQGEQPAAWTDYTSSDGNGGTTTLLPPATTSVTLSNLEAGATYEVQVRGVSKEDGAGPWSDIGEGTANRPPTPTSTAFNGGTFPVGSIATYAEAGQGALGPFFGDPEGDALAYSASAQHPALLSVGLSGAAGSATLTATLLNPGASQITYTATDPYGGQVTRTATITGTAKTSRSVAENSAAGTAVGAPVTGTPYDDGDPQTDDALSYTLEGKAKDSGKFVIDSASGQISVAQGATLDYETDDAHREAETFNGEVIAKFYRGEVHYTVDGHAAVINVSILVTDVEAGKPNAPSVTRTTFSQQSDPALDVTWTAPAANGATITGYNARYRVKVAQGETANAWTDFTVTGADDNPTTTLPATPTSINLPDLTAGTTYEAQVRALTKLEGEGPWSDIGEGRANRVPRTGPSRRTSTLGSFIPASTGSPTTGRPPSMDRPSPIPTATH